MRAVLLLLLAALLVSAAPVFAQSEAPALRADPSRAELSPGAQFRGELSVTNSGGATKTFALSVDSATVRISLDAPVATLAPGETQRVGFLVQVPTTHAAGEMLVRFEATDGGAIGAAYLIVHVAPPPVDTFDAGLLPATDLSSLSAVMADGGRFEGRVVVTNLNASTQTFPVRVRAPPGWTASVAPLSLTLGPRESGTLDVRMDPTSSARNGTGGVEIGEKAAHALVAVHLNLTHANATRVAVAAGVRLAVEPSELTIRPGEEARIALSLTNDGDEPWSGAVRADAWTVLGLDGPTEATVPARSAISLDYRIRSDPHIAPDQALDVTFHAGDATATARVFVAPPMTPSDLSISIDKAEVQFWVGEAAEFNVTISNAATADIAGDLFLRMPLGVSLSGNTSFVAPARGSVTLPLALGNSWSMRRDLDGEVAFFPDQSTGPSATLVFRIRVDPDAPFLDLRVGPESLGLDVGESATLRVVVSNTGGSAWRGGLRVEPFGNVTVIAPGAQDFAVEAGETQSMDVRVTRTGDGLAGLQLAARDAQLLYMLDDPSAATLGVGGIVVSPAMGAAIATAGVGTVAGGVALAQRRWPLVFAGLYARLAPSRLLEHPERARIRRLVDAQPGVTRNEIGRQLALAPGALDHHLGKLVAGGFVVAVPDGQLRRHFVAGSGRPEARAALDERILGHVRSRGPIPAAEVARELGASRQALHYHLRRMAREGSIVVERGPAGLTLRAP